MVRPQMNIRSLKNTTVRVQPVGRIEVSTAIPHSWSVQRILGTAPKAVHVRDEDAIDLESLNRTLRGQSKPIVSITTPVQEQETA